MPISPQLLDTDGGHFERIAWWTLPPGAHGTRGEYAVFVGGEDELLWYWVAGAAPRDAGGSARQPRADFLRQGAQGLPPAFGTAFERAPRPVRERILAAARGH